MADLSKLSDEDLDALSKGDLSKVSDDGLQVLSEPDNKGESGASILHAAKVALVPSAGIAEALAANPKESQAALEHFGNAASLGYLPQIQAATEPAMTKALDLITGNNVSQDLPGYTDRRDENLRRIADESANSPKASLAGSAAGALSGGIATSALAPARAATIPGRIAQAVRDGAIVAGLSNPGDTEGAVDPLQLAQRTRNAEMGAATGGIVQGAGEALGGIGGYLSDKAKGFAEKKAFKALGPLKRDAINNAGEINAIGRAALDSGVVSGIPTGAEGLAERASTAADAKGQEIGRIVDEISGLPDQPSPIDRKAIADRMRESLLGNPEVPGIAKRNQYFNSLIDEFEAGGAPLDLNKARELKMAVGGAGDQKGLINWNRLHGSDIPLDEQFHRELYTQLKNAEDELAVAAEKGNYGQSSSRFQDAKDTYGRLKTAQAIAQKRSAADIANRTLGLTDTNAGGAGAVAGSVLAGRPGAYVGGTVGALGNKAGRTYGNQVLAAGADQLSSILERAPGLAAAVSKNPALAPEIMALISKQNSLSKGDFPDYGNRTPADGSETAVSRRLKNSKR